MHLKGLYFIGFSEGGNCCPH